MTRERPFFPVGSSDDGSTTRRATAGNPLCSATRPGDAAAISCARAVTSDAA